MRHDDERCGSRQGLAGMWAARRMREFLLTSGEVDVKHSSIAIWAAVAAFAAACSSEEPHRGTPKANNNGAPKAEQGAPKGDDNGTPPAEDDLEIPNVDTLHSALERDTSPQLSDSER